MSYARAAAWAGVLAMLAAMPGCRDAGGPEPITPGTAVVSLASAATDGAILMRVTGPGFSTPQAVSSDAVLYWRQNSESEIVVAVFGAVTNGPVFRVDVPDTRNIGRYQATVLQVADRSSTERTDLTSYGAHVTAAQ